MSFQQDFFKFLKEYRILSLAIAFVVGLAVKDLVSSTVDDLIMPLINILLPGEQWEEITLSLPGAEMRIGLFLSNLIDFLIVALLVFVFVKYALGKDEVEKI